MIQIPLRNRSGEIVAHALIDDQDAALAAHPWCLSNGYAVSRRGGGPDLVRLHRAILELPVGDPRRVDHINRDPLDNRRTNLRIVTDAQNSQNVGSHRDSTSPYRGVSWYSRRGKWLAQVTVGGTRVFCGYFDLEREAADACRAVRRERMPFAAESVDAS